MSMSVSLEWGQLVLLGSDPAVVRRAVKHLESIRVAMLVAPVRADGSLTARTARADWSLKQVLRLYASLKTARFDAALVAGVVSAPYDHRQGGPSAERETLPVQRTLLRVDEPADTDLRYPLQRAADRLAVTVVDGPAVLRAEPAVRTSLAVVEYDIDAQPAAAERWLVQDFDAESEQEPTSVLRAA